MVQAFRVAGGGVTLDAKFDRLSRRPVVFRAMDDGGTLMVAITEQRVRPEWIASDALDSYEYQLYLTYFDADRELLFIAAPSDSAARELRDLVGAKDAPLISPQLINRWLWKQNLVAYSSVGMRSARAPGARQASYRMLAGSAVEGALLPSESRSYAVGHLIGRRRDGDRLVGLGVSIGRSKIWETAAAESLLEFRNWSRGLAEALGGTTPTRRTAPRLQLAVPDALEEYPEHPLTAVLNPTLLQAQTFLYVEGKGWIDAIVFETPVERLDSERMTMRWALEDDLVAELQLRSDGRVAVVGDDPIVRHEGAQTTLSQLLLDSSPWIYFADGSSVDGSTLLVPPFELPMLPADLYREWDFSTTDRRREAKDPRNGMEYNVQRRTIAWAEENLDAPLLVIDDASYEIADVIAIERDAAGHRVHLFHCKFSSDDNAGARLGDLYEVVGQGMRSARWTDSRACWVELSRRVRERNATEVQGMDRESAIAQFEEWAENPPGLELHVWVVQPGLSRAAMTGWTEGQTMLLAAMEWCVTQGAVFHVAGDS